MIKNVIFDMGNVLIYFHKDIFLDQAGVTGEDRKLLERVVFESLEWARLDRGSLKEAEAEKLMCARLPERLHGAVHYFIWAWDKPLRPVRGMATLARELKEKGYRLYLLSNAASRQHEYWHDIPGSEYFEGSLLSADSHRAHKQRTRENQACQNPFLHHSVSFPRAPSAIRRPKVRFVSMVYMLQTICTSRSTS